MPDNLPASPSNFIKTIIIADLLSGKHTKIIMRFPPEPNGYLHIGHAKAICINFGLAHEFQGICNLRLDDTNPEKENVEYVHSIQEDIKWLGFQWHGPVKYASDYFDKLYEFAIFFIQQGLAYVCDLTSEQIKQQRGSFVVAGTNSICRDRTISQNLDLFKRMRNCEFADGTKTLRLKIDMSSPNINLRDPVIYRIKRIDHIRTLDKWCIYPMYDYTHCISDALEGITHSCCSLEFEDHRPLYDWIIQHLMTAKLVSCHPAQIEFSRLNLQYTMTSKRKLNNLIVQGAVNGWDDPRLPTIAGMRRRGYTADGIKLFVSRCGVSKSPNTVDIELLESSIREDLENKCRRIMAVCKPLKVVLLNFIPDTPNRSADFHPQHEILGSRLVELTSTIYIEQDDFMVEPIAKWQRLAPGQEVRLRHSYIIRCDEVIYDEHSNVTELKCTIDYSTLGKNPTDRKVKGVIHWVSATQAIPITVRLYARLFTQVNPDIEINPILNPDSLTMVNAYIEPSITLHQDTHYQFERLGYYNIDSYDSTPSNVVFNKIVNLKDKWHK